MLLFVTGQVSGTGTTWPPLEVGNRSACRRPGGYSWAGSKDRGQWAGHGGLILRTHRCNREPHSVCLPASSRYIGIRSCHHCCHWPRRSCNRQALPGGYHGSRAAVLRCARTGVQGTKTLAEAWKRYLGQHVPLLVRWGLLMLLDSKLRTARLQIAKHDAAGLCAPPWLALLRQFGPCTKSVLCA
jgi:hypothetical protein